MIEVRGLCKRFGSRLAVEDCTFNVEPGRVTGFLGPNGAGKSTTMRMIMGIDAPSGGSVRINGQTFGELRSPLRTIGALLDCNAFHPGRSARHHLLASAQSNSIPESRVDEVIDLVGLSSVADRRAGTFSLGMRQRLGIAGALVGDPGIVVLDEPVNGLDPEGIMWVRRLLNGLASEGRTVFVSSHLMSEMALTIDQVVVIGRGRVIAQMPTSQFVRDYADSYVLVRTADPRQLSGLLRHAGASVTNDDEGALIVGRIPVGDIGQLAAAHQIVVLELSPQHASLEDAYMNLTRPAAEFRGLEQAKSIADRSV